MKEGKGGGWNIGTGCLREGEWNIYMRKNKTKSQTILKIKIITYIKDSPRRRCNNFKYLCTQYRSN